MTEKELRKLKRSELLKLIDNMREKIDALRNENKELNEQLDKLIGNRQEPLDPEEEAETAVITNG